MATDIILQQDIYSLKASKNHGLKVSKCQRFMASHFFK